MSVSVLQAWDRVSRKVIFKIFGIDHVVLNPHSNGFLSSSLDRKLPTVHLFCFHPHSRSPMAEASLLPVCAISGLGAFMSSSHFSVWSRLIQRTQFLTTEDAPCQARKCLPLPLTRESESFVRKISQQHSSFVSSCCCLLLPLKFQLDPGFLFTSCSEPLSGAHYPPAVAQLLHSTSKVASCTWRVSWFPFCLLPWCIKPSGSLF